MVAPAAAYERMRTVWESVAERYLAYRLALPGSASFICQAELCDAYCCRAYSVELGDAEVERMARASGRQPVTFLESENGEPIRLPLARPFLLRRDENRCAQLRDDLACGEYEGRPNACRLYPHFVLVFDPESGRPVHSNEEAIREAVEASVAGGDSQCVALLLRHIECPGFTGLPMTEPQWRALFEETYRLQYETA